MRSTPIFALLATLAAVPAAARQNIAVYVNGSLVRFADTQPVRVDGRVLVPLRGVLEEIGADISWNESTQTVKAHMGDKDILLQLGSRTAQINGATVALGTPARRIGGSTMVPLRFLGEALGAGVDWDEPRQTVRISSNFDPGEAAPPDRDRRPVQRESERREFSLRVDGRTESFGTDRPYLRGTEVMVPMERMSQIGNFDYTHDRNRNQFFARDRSIRSTIGSRLVTRDGHNLRMETPSALRNGVLYVPLEFMEVASDWSATWNARTSTVTMTRVQK